MSNAKHTPTPWITARYSDQRYQWCVFPADDELGQKVAAVNGGYNADFIVEACNAYEELVVRNDETAAHSERQSILIGELVAALEAIMPERTGYMQSMSWEAYNAAVKQARAALAKASGK